MRALPNLRSQGQGSKKRERRPKVAREAPPRLVLKIMLIKWRKAETSLFSLCLLRTSVPDELSSSLCSLDRGFVCASAFLIPLCVPKGFVSEMHSTLPPLSTYFSLSFTSTKPGFISSAKVFQGQRQNLPSCSTKYHYTIMELKVERGGKRENSLWHKGIEKRGRRT